MVGTENTGNTALASSAGHPISSLPWPPGLHVHKKSHAPGAGGGKVKEEVELGPGATFSNKAACGWLCNYFVPAAVAVTTCLYRLPLQRNSAKRDLVFWAGWVGKGVCGRGCGTRTA